METGYANEHNRQDKTRAGDIMYNKYFRRHFDSTYDPTEIALYRKWFKTQWKMINKNIKIDSSERILEIGSALGGFYSFLGKDIDYTGLELDNEAVNFSNKHFQVNAFKKIPLEKFRSKKLFDMIFAFEVLEHFASPEQAVSKIGKLLNQNGVFCGTSPYPFHKNILADKTHRFVLHPTAWKLLFKSKGFRKVEVYPMSFIPFLWRVSSLLNLRIPFYLPFPKFISTTLIIARK